jgi:hypothetical protein
MSLAIGACAFLSKHYISIRCSWQTHTETFIPIANKYFFAQNSSNQIVYPSTSTQLRRLRTLKIINQRRTK